MKTRLIWAILVSLVDDIIAVVVVLWVLPLFGIRLSLYWLILIILTLGAFSFALFRIGNRTLMKNPLPGLTSMVGTAGRAVSPLMPQGMVKIKGELWQATSEEGDIGTGEEVIVVAQNGLNLRVRRAGNRDLSRV